MNASQNASEELSKPDAVTNQTRSILNETQPVSVLPVCGTKVNVELDSLQANSDQETSEKRQCERFRKVYQMHTAGIYPDAQVSRIPIPV